MEAKKIDVVYVLGTGSGWQNNEIRFSLRSLQKNLKNFGNLFIVGELPDFLQHVIHIPAKDIFEPGLNADGNIITKVLAACSDERLSQKFLFINDDHLVLIPTDVKDVPPLHKGDMTEYPEKYWKLNFWRSRLKRTMEVLAEKGKTTLHFDCHTPILFDKKIFPEIMANYNYQDDIGYTMKSLYGNEVYPDGPLLTNQKKTVFKDYTLAQLEERLNGPRFMSFNDQGLNKSLKWWLIKHFPSKCKYEKTQADDLIFDLYIWQLSGKNYQTGLALYKKHFNHRNLIKLFEKGESEYLRKKLNYKLMNYIGEL